LKLPATLPQDEEKDKTQNSERQQQILREREQIDTERQQLERERALQGVSNGWSRRM
jgi:hypothetical protein